MSQSGATDEVEIRAEDLWIDVERRPPGVQPVKTYSGVKMEHIPSGLIVFCGTEKSQLRNKELALIMLRAGLGELYGPAFRCYSDLQKGGRRDPSC